MVVKWAITVASIGATMLGTANAQNGIDLALPTVADEQPRVLFPQAVETDERDMPRDSMIAPLPSMETTNESKVEPAPFEASQNAAPGEQDIQPDDTVMPNILPEAPKGLSLQTDGGNNPQIGERIALPEAAETKHEEDKPQGTQSLEDTQESAALARFKEKMETWKVQSNTSLADLEKIIGMQQSMLTELALAREAEMEVLPDNRLSRTICRNLELPGLCQELKGTFK